MAGKGHFSKFIEDNPGEPKINSGVKSFHDIVKDPEGENNQHLSDDMPFPLPVSPPVKASPSGAKISVSPAGRLFPETSQKSGKKSPGKPGGGSASAGRNFPGASEIFSKASLMKAWEQAKLKGKAAGIDRVTIEEFASDLDSNLQLLSDELISGGYIPEPYRKIFIEKSGKPDEYRPLGIITLRDKIAQIAVYLKYNFIIDKNFADTSYAYRPGKGHTKAINRIFDFIKRGYVFALPVDIDDFFDTIDHRILFNKIPEAFTDPTVLKLIEMWVLTGDIFHGRYLIRKKGIAQGGVLSPLLSNIYLHDLDMALASSGFNNVRYADNILLLSKEKEGLKPAFDFLNDFLQQHLGLHLNKTERLSYSASEGFDFCGINLTTRSRTICQTKFASVMAEIKRITSELKPDELLASAGRMFEGFRRYYEPFETREQLILIEDEFRIRLASRLKKEKHSGELKDPQKLKDFIRRIDFNCTRDSSSFDQIKRELLQEITDSKYTPRAGADKDARRKVTSVRKKYEKSFISEAELNITIYGTSLGKDGNKLVLKREGQVIKAVAASKVKTVNLMSASCSVSTDAVKFCTENGIDIFYFDKYGNPYARTSDFNFINPRLHDLQLKSMADIRGKRIIITLSETKIKNQIAVIKYFTKNRRDQKTLHEIKEFTASMNENLKKLSLINLNESIEKIREKAMGHEGSAAVSYWKAFAALLPGDTGFRVREHQNAQNLVNICLNYGYGILYSRLTTAVLREGLNPAVSYIHAPTHKAPALVFDLIEQFRAPVIDRVIITMFSKNDLKLKQDDKGRLTDDSRGRLAKVFLSRINTAFIYREGTVTYDELFRRAVKDLIKYIKGEENSLRTYLFKW